MSPKVKTAFNEFRKAFCNFCETSHLGYERIFEDLLRYIIHGFSPNEGSLADWRYTAGDNASFMNLTRLYLKVMDESLNAGEAQWCDVWGTLYEELVKTKGKSAVFGQFFTPETVATMMAKICGDSVPGSTMTDPCCGSGRFILASHAENPQGYFVAQDIDYICVYMSTVNMLVHGVVGEAICRDTLRMSEPRFSYRINPFLNVADSPFHGIPHVIREPSN